MNRPDDDRLLDSRHQEVLRIIIHEHVKTGEPIGSRFASRFSSEQLSPATIRNIMADLTESGFIEQPHTSAGRVPTDKGYRYFVDELLTGKRRLAQRDARKIEELLVSQNEIKTMLARASRLLAELTNQVGVVLASDLEAAQLEHVEFVRIAPRRIVAIFVSRTGLVTHRVVEIDEDVGQDDLDRWSARFREQFAGLTLPDARARMVGTLREDTSWAQLLGQRTVLALVQWLETPLPTEGGDLILEGASHLLDSPEFKDQLRLREVMRTFEERSRLVRLLDRCLAGRGVQVIIGSEAQDPSLSEVALIASPYRAGAGTKGLVGIVGPRRMEYARAVALVDHLARTISETLGRDDGTPAEDEE